MGIGETIQMSTPGHLYWQTISTWRQHDIIGMGIKGELYPGIFFYIFGPGSPQRVTKLVPVSLAPRRDRTAKN